MAIGAAAPDFATLTGRSIRATWLRRAPFTKSKNIFCNIPPLFYGATSFGKAFRPRCRLRSSYSLSRKCVYLAHDSSRHGAGREPHFMGPNFMTPTRHRFGMGREGHR